MSKINKIIFPLLIATPIIPLLSTSCGKDVEEKDADLFSESSWKTINKRCQSAIIFANAYCGYKGSIQPEAVSAIKKWIWTDKNIAYLDLDYHNIAQKVKIRLIGINEDILLDKTNQKDVFTFEFVDVIDFAVFELAKNKGSWYQPKTASTNEESCFLRKYCNEVLFKILPTNFSKYIKPVIKKTGAYAETGKVVQSEEYLFPLSVSECLSDTRRAPENELYTLYTNPDKSQVKNYLLKYLTVKFSPTDEPLTIAEKWWTRSPNEEKNMGESQYSYLINTKGYEEKDNPSLGAGIAPAFCI